MGNVPAPSGGLKSSSNYILYSGCNPVTDLSVTIEITENIVADCGFSFQLNCNSPLGANVFWQQYVIAFFPPNPPQGLTPTLSASINNWATNPQVPFIEPPPFFTFPGKSPTLQAGYQLTISLSNDGSGNITGATFTVVDNQGNIASQVSPLPANPEMVAPIYSFSLVLVGKTNAENDYLTAGAGTIIYSATSPLTALGQHPGCSYGTGTAEQANSVYSELPEGASTQVVQTFSTSVPPAYTPGGRFGVSRQAGLDQTNLYAVSRTGQLDVFSVQGEGRWKFVSRLGEPGLLRPYAAVAASEQFGAGNQTGVFAMGQAGFDGGGKRKLWMFSVSGAGGWNEPQEISVGSYEPGGALAASRQFGLDQTDVFLVDSHGQLSVFSVQGAGTWTAQPLPIGASGFAPGGSPVAASQRFGVANQTDVFVVDNDGQLNVFSVQGAGTWSGPVTIGSKGIFPQKANIAVSQQSDVSNQTDVFVVDNDGQLNMFWVQGLGNWSDSVKIGAKDFAVPGAPVAATQQFGATNRTDVFLVDKTGTLHLFWTDGAGLWHGPKQMGPTGIAPLWGASSAGAFVVASEQFGAPNQTDVFLLNEAGTNGPGWPTEFWVGGSGPWGGPVALVTEA